MLGQVVIFEKNTFLVITRAHTKEMQVPYRRWIVGGMSCRHRCALLGWMTCRQDQYRFEKLSNIIKQLASQEWSSYVFIESFLEFPSAT
jgi:hypothetical protein